MKRYIAVVNVGEGKIPLIKLIRHLTDASLVDAKDYVESNVNDFHGYMPRTIELMVTESQLGQFLIREAIEPSGSYSVLRVEELKQYRAYDLTPIKGRE